MCGCLEFDLIWFDFVLRCISIFVFFPILFAVHKWIDYRRRGAVSINWLRLRTSPYWDDEKVNEKKRREPVTKIEDYGISKISKIK